MTTTARVASALVCLMVGMGPALAGEAEGIEAKAAFDRLKTLEGEWKVSGETDHHGSKSIFKVTAAGSTIKEEQFPGSDHEMVNMFHLDGKDLLVTHYCAAGNQPRLKLDLKGSRPDFYSFVYESGTNLNPSKDMHIHAIRLKFLEGGKVESEWDGYLDGKLAHLVKLTMSRP